MSRPDDRPYLAFTTDTVMGQWLRIRRLKLVDAPIGTVVPYYLRDLERPQAQRGRVVGAWSGDVVVEL